MAVQRCPRCDQVVYGKQPVHWRCVFQRAGIPLSIMVLTILVVLSGSLLVVHFVAK